MEFENECPICFEELSGEIIMLDCNHKFHTHCIGVWFDKTLAKSQMLICPQCNIQRDIKNIYILKNNNNISELNINEKEDVKHEDEEETKYITESKKKCLRRCVIS